MGEYEFHSGADSEKQTQAPPSPLAPQPSLKALLDGGGTGGVIGGAIGGLLGGPAGAIMGSMAGAAAQMFLGMYDHKTKGSGLGKEVDGLIEKSPTLTKNLESMKKSGWVIKYGDKGSGTSADPQTKTIIIDPSEKGNPTSIVQSLAHESGHALYTQDPYVDMPGHTKDEYVQANLMRHLKDEGEATITNLQVREEILKATGGSDGKSKDIVDIGVSGKQSETYKKLYAKYPDPKDRDKLRAEIGKVFENGEEPSGDVNDGLTYGQYYSKTYEEHWDKHHAPKKK